MWDGSFGDEAVIHRPRYISMNYCRETLHTLVLPKYR